MAAKTAWNVRMSSTARRTNNRIRAIVEGMKIVPNPTKEMISLSLGDPTHFAGFEPSDVATTAVVESVSGGKNNGYVASTGTTAARMAVAEYCSEENVTVRPEDVILASGCSGALDLCITCLANTGDNILLPRPGFGLYQTLAESKGIECRFYECTPEHDWQIDLKGLVALIDAKTACILVNNPSNPCGSNFTKEHIEAIVSIAEAHKLPIISDEIYADMVFDGTFTSFASMSKNVPVLTTGGIAKRHLVPGWRLGWIVVHDRHNIFEEVRTGLGRLSQLILGPCGIIQGALPAMLKDTDDEFYRNRLALLKKHAQVSFDALSEIPGLKPVKASGAMYLMVGIDISQFPDIKDDLDFTQRLISEQSVFCLPGVCFGYPNFFRIVTCANEETLKEAADRISLFCDANRRVL